MPITRFTKEHEYIRIEDGIGTIGITDFAQNLLGDVIFVDLPAVGKVLARGADAAVVESVKAASDVYTPVSGEIVEVNNALQETPGTVNEDPAGKGWFLKIKLADQGELDALMDEAAYQNFLKSLS
jgi:glycine cleavage system H protein